ncbi:hypothetical protein CALCODRAFT_512585 [Calocera cornea HHB12733]|uniref:CxC2-like cysteine cluster KDZ transposase-associated domain-containing protein n=1 Tax=Calocera cornea HHB12733 TaxID=1353952 RepID=A0A165CXJ1_9BASI|nr:hypothetical protein CALCODRAFT_512585 [Calocera cornea HHB12733]
MPSKRKHSAIEPIDPLRKSRGNHELVYANTSGTTRYATSETLRAPGRTGIQQIIPPAICDPHMQETLVYPHVNDPLQKPLNAVPTVLIISQSRSHDPMDDFLKQRSVFSDEMFRHEYNPAIGVACMSCRHGPANQATTLCDECFAAPPLCVGCQVDAHSHSPFHWIRRWTGTFFERVGLQSLGLVVTLCRERSCCPPNPAPMDIRPSFTVVHINGVHRIRLRFCQHRHQTPRFVQLLRMRLFPSTIVNPRTAFTFDVMNDFHLLNLISKVPAYDYYGKLARLTSNLFPSAHPDRYKELLRVDRWWRELQSEKRSGESIGLLAQPPGAIGPPCRTIPCPACPQLSMNVTEEELLVKSREKPHVVTAFIGGDGNFRLSLRSNHKNSEERSFRDGKGYFPRENDYEDFLLRHNASETQLARTCSQFRNPNLLGGPQGKRCTGIFGTSCLRHTVYQSLVDLHAGERIDRGLRFVNVDYAFAKALELRPGLPRYLWSYDLCCSWVVNLRERFSQRFPELVNLLDKFQWVVPKFHVWSHKESCQYFYSLSLTRGSGRVDGEGVERPWAELRQLSSSTKEMTAAHRTEIIEDHINFWNYCKVIDMRYHLARKRKEVSRNLRLIQQDFDEFCEAMGRDRIQHWSQLDDAPALDDSGRLQSVYKLPEESLPSRETVYTELLSEESKRKDSMPEVPGESDRLSLVTLVDLGIGLEQARNRNIPGQKSQVTVEDEQELRRAILEWDALRDEVLPGLDLDIRHDNSLNEGDLSIPPLHLPSNLPREIFERLGVEEIVDIERRLREGQATDALQSLSDSLRVEKAYLCQRVVNSHGQSALNKARALSARQRLRTRMYATVYRQARDALLRLGIEASDPNFPPLHDADIRLPSVPGLEESVEGSQRLNPWFMNPGRFQSHENGTNHTAWPEISEQVNRTRYWRMRAAVERWTEEWEILIEEQQRTLTSYRYQAGLWQRAMIGVHERDQQVGKGKVAYAARRQDQSSLMSCQPDKVVEDRALETFNICRIRAVSRPLRNQIQEPSPIWTWAHLAAHSSADITAA